MAPRPLLLLFICAGIAGCQTNPDQALVGAWSTNRRLSHVPSFLQGGRRSVANGIYATQLKLSSDHTFVLAGFRQMGGKWSYSQGELTLTQTDVKADDKWKIEGELRHLRVNPDFTHLTITIHLPPGDLTIVFDKTA